MQAEAAAAQASCALLDSGRQGSNCSRSIVQPRAHVCGGRSRSTIVESSWSASSCSSLGKQPRRLTLAKQQLQS